MTPQHRNLALLLFLSVSPLLHSHLFTHAASTSPPVTLSRIFMDDDYDYEDENHKTLTPVKIPVLNRDVKPCKLDPCSENQEPCPQLHAKTGCLCPGLSGPDEPPHAPRIKGLLQVKEGDNRGKVEIQWCAPSSVVTGYRVVVEGREGDALQFGKALRRSFLESLEAGTKVCVEAVNNAGHSMTSEFSCERVSRPASSDDKLLVGVIGGGIVLLLLLIIAAVILWKHHMHKKAKRDSNDGLRNPSYSTEGNL
ncbi:leucine-rich repeat neuronal protein 4 [Scomber scombrus]|uniref:Leucine-rich repeat neuronal protein 4 n=1 Tax=Scomber scombrus TaxID=13677 RepID=A0AAV1PL60_SCOSC